MSITAPHRKVSRQKITSPMTRSIAIVMVSPAQKHLSELEQQRREERMCLGSLIGLALISTTFTALTVELACRSTGVRYQA